MHEAAQMFCFTAYCNQNKIFEKPTLYKVSYEALNDKSSKAIAVLSHGCSLYNKQGLGSELLKLA